MKSDNAAEIGMHVFERAGLGKAPFKLVHVYECVFKPFPDAPARPGRGCSFCGTGIMTAYELKSADGKYFVVGCNCVEKTGDTGLIKAYKTHPEHRALLRQKAALKDAANIAEWKRVTTDPESMEKLSSVVRESEYRGKEPWLTFALRAWDYCGASGRANYLRAAKKILAGTHHSQLEAA